MWVSPCCHPGMFPSGNTSHNLSTGFVKGWPQAASRLASYICALRSSVANSGKELPPAAGIFSPKDGVFAEILPSDSQEHSISTSLITFTPCLTVKGKMINFCFLSRPIFFFLNEECWLDKNILKKKTIFILKMLTCRKT